MNNKFQEVCQIIAMLYVIFLVFVPFVSAEEIPPPETVQELLIFSEYF